jgi:hypothetical protein
VKTHITPTLSRFGVKIGRVRQETIGRLRAVSQSQIVRPKVGAFEVTIYLFGFAVELLPPSEYDWRRDFESAALTSLLASPLLAAALTGFGSVGLALLENTMRSWTQTRPRVTPRFFLGVALITAAVVLSWGFSLELAIAISAHVTGTGNPPFVFVPHLSHEGLWIFWATLMVLTIPLSVVTLVPVTESDELRTMIKLTSRIFLPRPPPYVSRTEVHAAAQVAGYIGLDAPTTLLGRLGIAASQLCLRAVFLGSHQPMAVTGAVESSATELLTDSELADFENALSVARATSPSLFPRDNEIIDFEQEWLAMRARLSARIRLLAWLTLLVLTVIAVTWKLRRRSCRLASTAHRRGPRARQDARGG